MQWTALKTELKLTELDWKTAKKNCEYLYINANTMVCFGGEKF